MDRETFAQRLHQASIAARDLAREFFFLETLPDEMLFRVLLNQSYAGNPRPDERLYPDNGLFAAGPRQIHSFGRSLLSGAGL
jgi:hypothetical protein